MTDGTRVRWLAGQVGLTVLVFAALDYVWLGLLMRDFYRAELGALARQSADGLAPVWWAAFAVYAVLVTGLVVFVLPRTIGSPSRAASLGGLFGLVTYGTYDFTGHAVIAGWSLRMTLVDLAWGTVICGLTAAVVTAARPRISQPVRRSPTAV